MAIVKWSPFRELDLMERRMRRFLEEAGWAPGVVPAADVYETKDEYVVELEVPGFEEKDLAVEAFDHTVLVKGARAEVATKEEEKIFRLRERLEREFERTFALPPEADTARLKAVFEHGILEVHAPKTPEAKPRTIAITHS
jgi:HSP20 family protein